MRTKLFAIAGFPVLLSVAGASRRPASQGPCDRACMGKYFDQ
jgi:hypothetical protein